MLIFDFFTPHCEIIWILIGINDDVHDFLVVSANLFARILSHFQKGPL